MNDPGRATAHLNRSHRLVTGPCRLPSGLSRSAPTLDDVEFGAGGTLVPLGERLGAGSMHVVCTDGSKGTWDASADIAELVARRREEQREANRRLNGGRPTEVVFLDRVDGETERGSGGVLSRRAG